MTTLQLNEIIPRLSWWKDAKQRTWVITGFTEDYNTHLPTKVEMLELYETVPIYVPVLDILTSIEKGQMIRMYRQPAA